MATIALMEPHSSWFVKIVATSLKGDAPTRIWRDVNTKNMLLRYFDPAACLFVNIPKKSAKQAQNTWSSDPAVHVCLNHQCVATGKTFCRQCDHSHDGPWELARILSWKKSTKTVIKLTIKLMMIMMVLITKLWCWTDDDHETDDAVLIFDLLTSAARRCSVSAILPYALSSLGDHLEGGKWCKVCQVWKTYFLLFSANSRIEGKM